MDRSAGGHCNRNRIRIFPLFTMYSDEGGFDDLLPNRATTTAPTYSFPADDSLDENPFADMESSRIVYDQPESSPFGSSASQEVTPGTTQVQERRFERESAPEPETPFGQNYDDASFAGTSPSPYYPIAATSPPPVPQPSRQQSKAEMAALMGEPTPILPHFAATFKSTRPATTTTKALPVNLTGKKQGGGALAALLGFDPTPEQIASAADKVDTSKPAPTTQSAQIPAETTAISSPLPPSPSTDDPPGTGVSRTPSLAPSTLSEISTTAGTSLYGIIVSPMDSSESTVDGEGGSRQLERTVEAQELEEGLKRLHVKEEEGATPTGDASMESNETAEAKDEATDETTPTKTQLLAPIDTALSSPTPIPTVSETPQIPAVRPAAIEAPALPTTPLFEDHSTQSCGFRSYNYDEPMGEGFGGPEHQTSFSQDQARSSMGMERDDSLRTIGLESDQGSMLSVRP